MKPHDAVNETKLDSFIRTLRFRKIKSDLKKCEVICDLGCGQNAYNFKYVETYCEKFIGIDKILPNEAPNKKIEFISYDLDSALPLANNSVDFILSLALIEHLTHYENHLSECYRILKKNGVMLLTTPTKLAKPVLDFMAFTRVISKEAILDHKTYFTRNMLIKILMNSGFGRANIYHQYFQCGLNNFVKVIK